MYRDRRVEYTVPIEGGAAVYAKEVLKVRTDGDIRIETVPGGSAYVTNEAGRSVKVNIQKGGRERELCLDVGQVAPRMRSGVQSRRDGR